MHKNDTYSVEAKLHELTSISYPSVVVARKVEQ